MQSKRWSLRLDDETRELLAALAKYQKRTRAGVIVNLIHTAAQTELRSQNKKRQSKITPASAHAS